MVVHLSTGIGHSQSESGCTRLDTFSGSDGSRILHPVSRLNLFHQNGRGDMQMFHSADFCHAGNYVVGNFISSIHDFENDFAAFSRADDMVMVVIYETDVPDV